MTLTRAVRLFFNRMVCLKLANPQRVNWRMREGILPFKGRAIEPTGIRTPWYCRNFCLFDVLSRNFTYDSSVPNASGLFSSGSNSGCCSVFPYAAHDRLLELPLTLPPDSTAPVEEIYSILERTAGQIIDAGGVVVATFHPQPHQSANRRGLDHFFGFLQNIAERYAERLWCATPSEILRRYRSRLDECSPAAQSSPRSRDGFGKSL
jgi:hypothetical protein